jgi:hypothetical protein
LELQRREEELKTLNEKAQLNQLQIQIGRLKVELSAKDNDVKRLKIIWYIYGMNILS